MFLKRGQKHVRSLGKSRGTDTPDELKPHTKQAKEDSPSQAAEQPSADDSVKTASALVKRSDVHKHGGSPIDRLGRFLKKIHDIHSANQGTLLGYIPTSIFMGLSVITLGLYPYIWFAQHVSAFIILSLEKIDEGYLRRYVVIGIIVQLMAVSAVVLALWGIAADSALKMEYAFRFAFFYVSLTFFVLIPIRSFLYFGLRWNLRRAVARWDGSHIMLPRTMPSWWKLFLLGSLYLQHHINRVIGLGMPGFADAEEVRESLPFLEWLGVYLTGFNEPVSKGRR